MELKNSVVVITGASSGIGKGTAIKFAEQGANLVLVARRKEALQKTAEECQKFGVETLVIATDVSVEASIHQVCKKALKKFGNIDVWVNNAGVYELGKFEELPTDLMRQLMETNFWSYVYGVQAVLPVMKKQKSGIIINTVSVFGKIPAAYASIYCASKFALHGLLTAIRHEVEEDGIKICNVYPSSIDTPLFERSPNYSGKKIVPMKPLYSPWQVAETIVSLAEHPKAESIVGLYGKLGVVAQKVFPQITQNNMSNQVKADHFDHQVHVEDTSGNVFKPLERGTGVDGGWRK